MWDNEDYEDEEEKEVDQEPEDELMEEEVRAKYEWGS